ncbi:MAG: autotransporter-associated beta strand repeat-containing protein [Verrucomicrobia bacterium]|nr:autotransporter-associated beta strand repeat-containing protein [Verrucomicrobiota bacterium]
MKTKLSFPLLLALLAAIPAVASAATLTWVGGSMADGNWSTLDNWDSGVPAATGDNLVFDTSNNLTGTNNVPTVVTSVIGLTYNATAGSFVTSGTGTLTLAGDLTNNSTNTQTLAMPIAITGARTVSSVANGKVVFGSTGTGYSYTLNNGTSLFTGAGEVQILTSSAGGFQVGQANTTTLDMTGLAKFTANVGTFRVMGTATSTATLKLAADSSITATILKIGDTLGGTTLADGILRLGSGTIINATTINLGSTRTDGTMNFNVGLTSPVVTIAGTAGGASKADMTLGYYQTNPGNYNPTGIADFTGGTVNAGLGTVILGRQAPNGAVTGVNNTAAGTWTMAAGTVAADTVRLGYWSGGNTGGAGTTQLAQGTLNINGGSFTIATALRVGDGVVGNTNTNTHARGFANVSNGTLNVAGLFLLGNDQGDGASANQQGTLAITGGTVNSTVDITTFDARSTLTLNGGTLDMKGNKIGSAAQPIGNNGGALNLQSGTLQNLSDLNGGAALTKTGSGTLTLAGTNTYPGGTMVSAGTLLCATQASLYNNITTNWTPAMISVAAGATLAFKVGGINEFTTSDVSTLLTNLSVVSDNGLKAGSNIGFDTTTADGLSFTVADLIADSTGTGSGSLGVAKLGANTLVLSNANTYSGATTVVGGTLSLSGSIANSAAIDIRSGALLDASALGGWSLGATQTLMGSGTLLGHASTSGTVSPGASIGTLSATGNFTFASGSSLATEIIGVPQVETATVPATTVPTGGTGGNVTVTVTGADIVGSPLVVTVAVSAGDTGVVWAGKVRDALAATPAITALYSVGGVSASRTVTLTRKTAEANDPTLNIALANGLPSPGITTLPVATSANTTAGAVPSASDLFAVSGALDITGATLNLTANGPLEVPFVIATYGSRTGTFAAVNGLPPGSVIDYAYGGNQLAITNPAPPVWASGWPKISDVTTTGFTARSEIDEAGTAWFVVLAAGTAAPGTAQVKAGLDGNDAAALKSGTTALTANAEAASPVADLSPGTAYDVWFVAQDAFATPNVQGSPVKVAVTTLGLLTPYQVWIGGFSVGVLTGPTDDPDGDGVPNFLEFALNSSPADGTSQGKVFVKMATVGATPKVLTLTVATRSGAAFAAAANNQVALVVADSLTYLIEAANTLTDWGVPLVTEVTDPDDLANIQAGLPAADSGWAYHSFRSDGDATTDPGDFIRVKVTSP